MPTSAFENLCGQGKPLRPEPPDAEEFAGLVRAALKRLNDAGNLQNAIESRFDLSCSIFPTTLRMAFVWRPFAGTAIAHPIGT